MGRPIVSFAAAHPCASRKAWDSLIYPIDSQARPWGTDDPGSRQLPLFGARPLAFRLSHSTRRSGWYGAARFI